jgi:outer membrane murein-binding lipoprotein Lpp
MGMFSCNNCMLCESTSVSSSARAQNFLNLSIRDVKTDLYYARKEKTRAKKRLDKK